LYLSTTPILVGVWVSSAEDEEDDDGGSAWSMFRIFTHADPSSSGEEVVPDERGRNSHPFGSSSSSGPRDSIETTFLGWNTCSISSSSNRMSVGRTEERLTRVSGLSDWRSLRQVVRQWQEDVGPVAAITPPSISPFLSLERIAFR